MARERICGCFFVLQMDIIWLMRLRLLAQYSPLKPCTLATCVWSHFLPTLAVINTSISTSVILWHPAATGQEISESSLLGRSSAASAATGNSSPYLPEQDIRNGICSSRTSLVWSIGDGQSRQRKLMWDVLHSLFVENVGKCSDIVRVYVCICDVIDSPEMRRRYDWFTGICHF